MEVLVWLWLPNLFDPFQRGPVLVQHLHCFEVLHEVCDQQPSAADGSGITALSWVEMLRENVKEFSFSSCTLLC